MIPGYAHAGTLNIIVSCIIIHIKGGVFNPLTDLRKANKYPIEIKQYYL